MNREGSNLSWKLEQDIFPHEDNEPISTSPLLSWGRRQSKERSITLSCHLYNGLSGDPPKSCKGLESTPVGVFEHKLDQRTWWLQASPVKLPPISIQNSKKSTTMLYNFQPLTYKSYIQELECSDLCGNTRS
jgi:hypothetical protein